jgi:hypothetical protein
MFRLVLSVLVVTLVTTSIAEARLNTANMSCDEANATVARAGSIVLSTGANTYDRFVATNLFCMSGETTEPGLAPTLDTRMCRIGYVCQRQDMSD